MTHDRGREQAAADVGGLAPVISIVDRSETEIPSASDEMVGAEREAAEAALVRRLRARALSVSEAETVLRSHGLDSATIAEVIDDCQRRGYLDDVALAENLVRSGSERKGQGRIALSRALVQRGIPREHVEAALSALPDDDAERALEFARTKSRALGRLDEAVALRRLVGQLARRGYGSSVAMTAARTALRETGGHAAASASGVRFRDSE